MPRSAGAPSTPESRGEALPGVVRWPKVMDKSLVKLHCTTGALLPVEWPGSFLSISKFLGFAAIAIAVLLFSLSSQLAIAQSPSTSASATADKGGGQVVNIDGVTYTFAKIAGMPEDEQMRLVTSIQNPLEKMRVGNYIRQAANQRVAETDARLQAANQRVAETDARLQAAKQRTEELIKQLVAKYEQYISNIERGARWEREIVERIANEDFAPQELKQRANAVLKNKRDTMISPASK